MPRNIFPILLLLIGCSGCSSVAPAVNEGTRVGTVNVVVWSVHSQRAVPAEGTLISRADGTRRDFTTRANPAEGATLTGLPAGPYRITVQRRLEPAGRPQRVEGAEEIYLEPGKRVEVTVVVTDREGELGLLIEPSSPGVSSSYLPLTTPRPAGPS